MATAELRNHIDTEEVLSSAVRLACDILKSDTAAIALVNGEGFLTFRSQQGLSPRFAKRWKKDPSDSLTGLVFRTGHPCVAPDILADERYKGKALAQQGIRGLLVAPLKSGDEVVGCLYIGQRSKRDFSLEEMRLAGLFADHVSLSIESAAILEEERQQRQRSEALLDVVGAPSLSLSLKKVLIKLCQSVLKLTVGERCSIFMFNEGTGTLDPVMSLGVEDQILYEKFQASAGLKIPEIRGIGEAIKAQEPVIEERAPGSGVIPSFWIDTFSIKSLALYPLVHREKTVGIMEVHTFSKFARFPQEEVETLAAIAKQAAVIIENARLYEQEQGQRQRAEALVEVLTTAASTLGLKKVLIKLCQAVVNISVGDRCSIFMMDKEGRTLEPVMSLGIENGNLWQKFRNAPRRTNRARELRPLFEALNTLQDPIVIEDATKSDLVPRWWVKTFSVKSLVQYPLRVKERTIGMMTVDAFRDYVQFPQEEVETLAAIAKQAAIIIENARLHEQVREQAITDAVSGLYNHRHLHERLDEEFARACRSNQPFAILMMDLDNFKFFNDTYGHIRGDEALKHAGGLLRNALRTSDIVGRYGGDEFLAILPETNREEAEKAGERIMLSLAENPFTLDAPDEPVPLGLSIGIACYPYDSGVKQELIALADAALYEAKRLGGDRVVQVRAAAAEPLPVQSLGFGLLQSLMNILAYKDPCTRRHCEDNIRYADLLSDSLQLPEADKESLRKAALLHDVGKIAIPDSTLLKPGPLDREEWEIMQQHVRFGEMIVKGISQISDAIEPVATHHERYDGKGYPRGLKGEDIPLLGRILAVVDAYSAMTLDRPYRKALSHEHAVQELRNGASSQFDPEIVDAFLEAMDARERARTRAA